MVQLLCGPVVGHVGDTSANVLLEVAEEMTSLSCYLRKVSWSSMSGTRFSSTSSPEVKPISIFERRVELSMPARRPRVFRFEGLERNCRYEVRIPAVKDGVLGTLRTLPVDISKIQVGVVSCDKRCFTPQVNMWQRMWERMCDREDDFHLLLHIGDNVYLDGDASTNLSNEEMVKDDKGIFDEDTTNQTIPYVRARRILFDTPKGDWPEKIPEILEIYRNEYRLTFNREYVKQVLANVSNMMILDDHDVRDDFGSVPEDSDPESADFLLSQLAIQCYHEYQRALWDPDIVGCDISTMANEFYSWHFGPIGLMMMEHRTVWSTNKARRREGDESYYGEQQMTSVRKLLGNPDVKFWIMVCPLPVVLLKRRFNKLGAQVNKRADDLQGFMNVRNEKDMQNLLDMIRTWRRAEPIDRDLLILSGDVHVGGFTDLLYKSSNSNKAELVCRQITTSPINNEHPGFASMIGLKALLHFTDTYGDFTYNHYDFINMCNYAVISVDSFQPKLIYRVKLVHPEGAICKYSTLKEWDEENTFGCKACALL